MHIRLKQFEDQRARIASLVMDMTLKNNMFSYEDIKFLLLRECSPRFSFCNGPSCNYENHIQSECDLMNSGAVTFLTKLAV